MRQAFDSRSRQYLREQCFAKRAEVCVVDDDRYKRIVGRVTCAVGDANATQTPRSMAWVYGQHAEDKTL